jgi:mannose-6-phosphate isomerase-like protein (cupin superfamily)
MDHGRIFIHEADVEEQPDICGAALDLINRDVSSSQHISVATIYVDAGKSSLPHFHKVMEEVYYFLVGTGEVMIGDERFEVSPGSAAFMPVGVVHHVTNHSVDRMKFLVADSPSYDPTDIFYPSEPEAR